MKFNAGYPKLDHTGGFNILLRIYNPSNLCEASCDNTKCTIKFLDFSKDTRIRC